MKIESVFSQDFRPYGKILEEYDFREFLERLAETPCPTDRVVYIPSEPGLEALLVSRELQERFYGGMPVQVGYCNGHNGTLNCLEYHRGFGGGCIWE